MSRATVPPLWSRSDGLRYGMLGLPLAFCALPLYVLMPNLYARQWGVPLAALGALLLGVRLFDALIDPLLGRLIDRLFATSLRAVLRLGAIAAAGLAVGFCLLFMPLPRAPAALLWWAGAWLVVTYSAYSALTVAHQSWGAMLGGDALYRSRVVAWREGLGLVGVLLAALTPALWGVPAMLGLLLIGLVAGCWLWRLAPQPAAPALPQCHGTPAGLGALWQPWRNADFRRLLGVFLLNGIASAVPATLVLFFVQDRLQAPAAMQAAALAMYFLCGALSMPLWLYLVGRLGLARAWRLGMALSIAVFLGASTLGAGDAPWFLLVCALSGAALGSDLALPSALLAGVIDAAGDRGRADARYFGWWNFATKINLALAAGLALPLLGVLGYTPGTREPHALALLTAAYCLLPSLLKAAALVALHCLILQPAARPPLP
jgi:Na+/melibiose symporter-like transporter